VILRRRVLGTDEPDELSAHLNLNPPGQCGVLEVGLSDENIDIDVPRFNMPIDFEEWHAGSAVEPS
jgi:hypothetical protein